MCNGVKQGGVLSATLFCVYMDELLSRLENSGVGCYIGNRYYGHMAYADDLKLLCPSISGLQKMLNICDEFSKEYLVTYNAKKTVAICYGGSRGRYMRPLYLHGESIRWETKVKYLGTIHDSAMSDNDDIQFKKNNFFGTVNKLYHQFSFASTSVRLKLFQSYCSAWYGSQNWQLGSRYVESFQIEWNKAIRKIMNLPLCTRTVLLPFLSGIQSFTRQIECRWIRFYNCIMRSTNAKVCYIGLRSLTNTIGCLGQNRVLLRNKYNIVTITESTHIPKEDIDLYIRERLNIIKEILLIRDGESDIPHFEFGELNDIMEYVCTY